MRCWVCGVLCAGCEGSLRVVHGSRGVCAAAAALCSDELYCAAAARKVQGVPYKAAWDGHAWWERGACLGIMGGNRGLAHAPDPLHAPAPALPSLPPTRTRLPATTPSTCHPTGPESSGLPHLPPWIPLTPSIAVCPPTNTSSALSCPNHLITTLNCGFTPSRRPGPRFTPKPVVARTVEDIIKVRQYGTPPYATH